MLEYPTFKSYSRKLLTLTLIFKNDEILLGMKNRGMGKGKWNGFGGKVEPNETIDDAAKREVKEECGLDVISMEKIGIIDFEYVGSKEILEGHIYFCDLFEGDIIESDEMAPIKWFKIKDSPCDTMWIDHKYWFPMILKKIPFKAHFKYLNDDTMIDSTIILSNTVNKTRETWVNVVVKKDNQILKHKNIDESEYLNKHEQVMTGESIENAALRYLKMHYEITTEEVQKIAVVNIELIDKPYIQEIQFFVVDISKSTNATLTNDYQWFDISNLQAKKLWPDDKFLSTLFMMKPFNAYFLIDNDNVLCSKYNNNE
ncbi:putative nudix hydrolase 1 [Aphis gossypii]|uniref:putative nudix hydrolase 1 n=1 Tax=Aphis gossypii TaxID=80765 RepID=UPI00100EB89C|nr:putative nudix hydrolase 1 [Aphis gossypii]XP_027837845.1 putative nudix hydrolase 1 [Aphis gossypii]XP_050061161.1 putative nudix hydrolase 1 [Aphis gossypii]XP_050061172.1 putative nudix hydrolase 1 [Aphis gossypii]